MAKKAKARRTWTAEHVRTLKKMAGQKEARIAHCQEAKAYRRGNEAEGF
jgi:hypothetical protein